MASGIAMHDSFRPKEITYWVWAHPQYEDLDLWQNCLVAAHEAADDKYDTSVAEKMYLARGGNNRRDRKKKIEPKVPSRKQDSRTI